MKKLFIILVGFFCLNAVYSDEKILNACKIYIVMHIPGKLKISDISFTSERQAILLAKYKETGSITQAVEPLMANLEYRQRLANCNKLV